MRSPSINAQVMRLTKVDACGRVVPGAASSLLTEGFASIKFAPEVESGDDKTTKKANGKVCASSKGEETYKWYNLDVELCLVDPDLMSLINPSWPTIINNLGSSVGWEATDVIESAQGVALETWSLLEGGDVCDDPTATGSWGYWLWPWTTGWKLGEGTLSGDYLNLTMSGRAKNESRWGKGPYDVVLNGTAPAVAGKLLQPIDARAFYHAEQTGIAPPVELPGLLGVSALDGPAFTMIIDPADATGHTVKVTIAAGLVGTLTVNWGDGTAPAVLASANTTHVYADPGVYNVAVYVTATPAKVSYAAAQIVE